MSGCQLVYRMERREPSPETRPDGVHVAVLSTPAHALKHFGVLVRRFGAAGAIKTIAKLATPSRFLLIAVLDREVACDIWMTVGTCRYYGVGRGDVVIGPVMTEAKARGRGLATCSMMHGINFMIRRRHTVFFNDTAEDNAPMRRVAGKCGFGEPVMRLDRAGRWDR